MKAIIVGGGIGGLATALALGQRGWQVEVLERAAEFGEVGAGLSLWPNALRALDLLGVGGSVRGHAGLAGRAGIRTSTGRWLARTDAAELERRYGPTAMIHRADLLGVLRAAVPGEALRGGITVRAVRPDGMVTHSGGESSADLIVGADGIRSVTRTSLFPGAAAPRYAGYTAWRMITPPVPVGDSGESWGSGERFGYAPLPDGRIYCFATANAAATGTARATATGTGTARATATAASAAARDAVVGEADRELDGLRRRFGGWHDPIPALLRAASPDAVLHDDLYELPPLRTYTAGHVVLIGDAAHAMTPNLGQGACQALEDAVVLGQVMDGRAGADIRAGLGAYDRVRRPRTQMIALRSHRIGRAAQWASPVAVGLRNTALRALPRSSFVRSLAPVLDWTG